MAKSLSAIFEPGVSVGSAATSYYAISGPFFSLAEANCEVPIREAGTFSNLFSYVKSNTITANTVVTLRKSRADTALTVTYASGETGIKEDTSNSVSYANTDEASFKIVGGSDAGGHIASFTVLAVQFEPTTAGNCITFANINTSAASNAASTTYYTNPLGGLSQNTNETVIKYKVRNSFTSSNFYCYMASNARTTNIVVGVRKNSANGNQILTYAAGETGVKEDTSNTDSFVANDFFDYYITTSTGSELFNISTLSSQILNTNDEFFFIAGSAFGTTVNFNVTTYQGVGGRSGSSTTEADTQVYPRFDFTAKELGTYVSLNTITTSPSTLTLRDNGADSSLTISYAAGETGLKQDTTNTTTITSATDEINFKMATPNTSGSIRFTWLGFLGDTSYTPPSALSTRSPGGGVAYSGSSFMF